MLGYRRFHTAGGQYHQGLKRLKKERIVSEPKKKRKDGNEVVGQVIQSWGTPSSQIYK